LNSIVDIYEYKYKFLILFLCQNQVCSNITSLRSTQITLSINLFNYSTSDVMLGFYKHEQGEGLEKHFLMIEEWLNMEL
jgi:hypothetical protein